MKFNFKNYIVETTDGENKSISQLKNTICDAIKKLECEKISKLKDRLTFELIENEDEAKNFAKQHEVDYLPYKTKDNSFDGYIVWYNTSKKVKDAPIIGSDVFDDLLDRAQLLVKEGHSVEDAAQKAVDEGLIYDSDILDLAKAYLTSEEIFQVEDLYYDDLQRDLITALENEELEDSKPNDKKSNELNDKEYKKYDVVTVYKDNNEETISYNNKEIALNEAKRDAKRDNVEYVEVVRYIIDDDTNEEIKDIIWTSEETKDSKLKITREPRKVAPRKIEK